MSPARRRLCAGTLALLPPGVVVPAYDRAGLRPGILHLGLGAFHRAHQAVYTDRALALSGGDWGILGVCMRGDAAARQLLPQDLLYSVRSRGVAEDRLQIVGALTGIVVAPAEPGATIAPRTSARQRHGSAIPHCNRL